MTLCIICENKRKMQGYIYTSQMCEDCYKWFAEKNYEELEAEDSLSN